MTEYILGRVDVVGLKKMSEVDNGLFSCLEKMLESTQESMERTNKAIGEGLCIRGGHMYGDTIDFYFESSDSDAAMIMPLIELLIEVERLMLEHCLVCRGAIVKGSLIVRDNIFTGSGLVEATEIEKKMITYGIGLSETVIGILQDCVKIMVYSKNECDSLMNRILVRRGPCTYINRYMKIEPAELIALDKNYIDRCEERVVETVDRYRSNIPLEEMHKIEMIQSMIGIFQEDYEKARSDAGLLSTSWSS